LSIGLRIKMEVREEGKEAVVSRVALSVELMALLA
jgi:hypothetical protein